ncbi:MULTISPECIES: hypothetical protein [unclassified Streptomyces]|uniref:hypothetical protein n=1 Tax=unclassified Streptomyces TaxID=2593676 RepID=UPI00344F2FC5
MAEQDITATAAISYDADGTIGGEVLFTPAGHNPHHAILAEPGDSPAAGDPAQLILGPGMNHDLNTIGTTPATWVSRARAAGKAGPTGESEELARLRREMPSSSGTTRSWSWR